jgi:hypothetical protein
MSAVDAEIDDVQANMSVSTDPVDPAEADEPTGPLDKSQIDEQSRYWRKVINDAANALSNLSLGKSSGATGLMGLPANPATNAKGKGRAKSEAATKAEGKKPRAKKDKSTTPTPAVTTITPDNTDGSVPTAPVAATSTALPCIAKLRSAEGLCGQPGINGTDRCRQHTKNPSKKSTPASTKDTAALPVAEGAPSPAALGSVPTGVVSVPVLGATQTAQPGPTLPTPGPPAPAPPAPAPPGMALMGQTAQEPTPMPPSAPGPAPFAYPASAPPPGPPAPAHVESFPLAPGVPAPGYLSPVSMQGFAVGQVASGPVQAVQQGLPAQIGPAQIAQPIQPVQPTHSGMSPLTPDQVIADYFTRGFTIDTHVPSGILYIVDTDGAVGLRKAIGRSYAPGAFVDINADKAFLQWYKDYGFGVGSDMAFATTMTQASVPAPGPVIGVPAV